MTRTYTQEDGHKASQKDSYGHRHTHKPTTSSALFGPFSMHGYTDARHPTVVSTYLPRVMTHIHRHRQGQIDTYTHNHKPTKAHAASTNRTRTHTLAFPVFTDTDIR
jgi:hypothetical protein